MRVGILSLLGAISFVLSFAGEQNAWTSSCRADALGVSRTIEINTQQYQAVGAYAKNPFTNNLPYLPLEHGEIILTFDDGPTTWGTIKNLDTLAAECLHASFMLIGKRAEASPEIVRRIREEGHTLGSHSWSHQDLAKLPLDQAITEIKSGYEAVERAAFGSTQPENSPRLFRFPNNSASPELFKYLADHRITSLGVDISPSDWRGDPPDVTFSRLRQSFDRQNRGILLLHDSQPNTAVLLPMIIAELKARGMKVVHLALRPGT